MIRLSFFLMLCLNFHSLMIGQNLVPNSGFEEINDTINRFTASDIDFNNKIKYWTTPNTASPDLITPDFEERFIEASNPHAGLMMIGIQAKIDWAEYIGIHLKEALIPNTTYHVEYWIRRAECISPRMNVDQIINKNFGILFSSESIKTSNGNMLLANPQIKGDTAILVSSKEWVKVSTYFTPKETYSELYLGQFRKEGEDPIIMKGYYFIDDISVKAVTDFGALNKKTALPIGSIIPLDQVYFLVGTTNLKHQKSYTILDELVAYLNLHPSINIRVNGHTDSNGSERSNLLLSKKRAKFIAQYLIQNGISMNRIKSKGFGEEHPIADNNTEAGRSKNRRVEFEIIQ